MVSGKKRRRLSPSFGQRIALLLLAPVFVVGVILALLLILLLAPVYMVFLWLKFSFAGTMRGWLRMKLGGRYTIDEIARRLDLPVDELKNFEPSYRVAVIPKRSGGTRQLLIPDDATKRLQRRLLQRVLRKLRAHPAAVGFECGKSIVDNALPHVGRSVVIKCDIQDFFDTTTSDRLEVYFRRIGWKPDAASLLVKLTTHAGGLPQGAPTSPRLSNLVNYLLDVRLSNFAELRKGHYTRYADDITFSFPKDYPRRVRGVVQKVRRVLKRHGYQLNHKKTRILRRHQRQCVTGLVVNDKVQIPRKQRRRLRAIQHHLENGRPATMTPAELNGWQSFSDMIQRQSEVSQQDRTE